MRRLGFLVAFVLVTGLVASWDGLTDFDLGAAGEGYVRVALVPSEEECAEAVAILDESL